MHKEGTSTVFNLIQSMSKAEKKHFRLYASYYSKNARGMNYLRLFDVMEKQSGYDEKKILEKGIIRKERFRAVKHYLYSLLLESLHVFRIKSQDPDTKLNHMLECARILRDKSLESEEIRLLRKTKELALKSERWAPALDSILNERTALFRIQDFKTLRKANAEMEQLVSTLDNLKEYFSLNNRLFTYILKAGPSRDPRELKKIMPHSFLRDENRARSVRAKMAFFDTLFTYYLSLGDVEAGYKVLTKQLKLLEGSNIRVSELTHSVILNNLIITQQKLGKYDEVLPTIQKQRALVWKSKRARISTLLYSYISETNYYILTGEFEGGAAMIPDIESHSELFNPEYTWQLNALYYNIAYIYFGSRNYHKTLQWVTAIINHPKKVYREDLQTSARILQILAHYELKTQDILEHLLDSTHRFLITREQRYKAEEHFLDFIRKIIRKDAVKKELQEEYSSFKAELLRITKNPDEKKLLEYFDLYSWLESKIENKSFAEVVRKKLKT